MFLSLYFTEYELFSNLKIHKFNFGIKIISNFILLFKIKLICLISIVIRFIYFTNYFYVLCLKKFYFLCLYIY
jgi:hypothetical protein